MTTKIEGQLEKLIDGQKGQAERDKTVLSEVSSIRETVERLHERLDGIHETTIVHSQQIKVLEKDFCKSEKNCHEARELIWTKKRESENDIKTLITISKGEAITTAKKDIKLWLYGVVVIALASGAASIIIPIIKTSSALVGN